ncbi:Acetyltransferase (GNAT) family protein [Halobacillus dabanensis]|uniref:Acetyltransferase (GNAT) family protein n=1 Tax=Halobacillus dabanensis TaxID=240302 RepID=A0A1I3S1U0_HALDA|nr:GNAT family N-acetyltransferase [Halobacillus dabanensis]SFJ51549.1 Acetyltransferase (GNAT) family protein [Halobacillus dabanensis]
MDADLLVKLYDLEKYDHHHINTLNILIEEGITIKRPLSLDRKELTDYVHHQFNEYWANEAQSVFTDYPVSCFIAVKDQQVIGFACYDATAKGFFGPVGVSEPYRGKGIGEVLTRECLLAMREAGYAYTIIGWVADETIPYYEQKFNAQVIEDSHPGIYGRMIKK